MKKGLGRGLSSLFNVYEEDTNETKSQKQEKPKVIEPVVEKPEIKENLNETTVSITEKSEIKEEPRVVYVERPVERPATIKADSDEKVYQLSIDMIDPNANQPRKHFDKDALNELADSIKIHGVIQPIVVTPVGKRYMIIAGERRWRASKLVGLNNIPAIIREYTSKEISEVSIIENLQREDLNPMEQARAIKSLIDAYGLTQEDVAKRLGKSRPLIANTIRLLNLEPEVIQMIEEGKLTAGHARSLVVVNDRESQIKLAKQVATRKLTVRDLERAVKNSQKKVQMKTTQSVELKQLVQDMQRVYSTKVSVIGNDNRGRIYIDYYSQDDLQRFYDLLDKFKTL